MLNDLTLISAAVRNWWYNLQLDNNAIWLAMVIAIVAAAFVKRIIKPPKT